MDINNPNIHKSKTKYRWNKSGLIYHDFDELYDIYINTMECNHCGKVFETRKERHLDHCHETGLFRKIVCCACNMQDSYIRYPDKITKQDKKDNEKKYYEKNKEKKKEYNKEYNVKNRDKIREQKRKRYQEKKQLGLN